MVTLRILPERLIDPAPSGERRYARNLSEQLIARAPAGCDVEAIMPKLTADELEAVETALPGLSDVTQAPLRRDVLAKAWRRGLRTGAVGGGFIHAMSLFAPIKDISMAYGLDQTVVTVHDTSALRRPELHDPDDVKFVTAMLKRAYRFASAVTAPTNAVADELMQLYDFGDRLRVIGGAADPRILLPATEEEGDLIAGRLGLPDDYVLSFATAEPRKGLEPLLRAFARPELADATLVLIGPETVGASTAAGGESEHSTDAVLASSGLPASRVVRLGEVSDAAVAVAMQRASAIVVPSLEAGFGLPIVEAFQFGTPVVASDAPALLEVGMDAVHVVARDDAEGYPERLAHAIARVLADTELARKLRVAGRDRANVHHWGISADMVWALHADL